MAQANLSSGREQITFGKDAVVVPNYISGIPGGRSLNVEGFDGKVVLAGHVIISKGADYKPMPVSEGAYGELPSGYSYAGILAKSISTACPMASIMTRGDVNDAAAPYKMDGILAAFKTACPHINFFHAEEE